MGVKKLPELHIFCNYNVGINVLRWNRESIKKIINAPKSQFSDLFKRSLNLSEFPMISRDYNSRKYPLLRAQNLYLRREF